MDASDIIDQLGGNASLAVLLGCRQNTISQWRRYGIPPARCVRLAAIAKQQRRSGVTLDVLMRSKPRARPMPNQPPALSTASAPA